MQLYQNNIQDRYGNAIARASVRVTDAETGDLSVLYSDNGTTTIFNPLETSDAGEFSFFAANGRYTITVSSPGVQVERVINFELADSLEIFEEVVLKADLANDTDPTKGPSLVRHNATLNYAVGTIGAVLNDVCINVKMFPWLAKGDGIADDAPAINAAKTAAGVGGTLIFPRPAVGYLCKSNVTQLQAQAWRGMGGQRGTTLIKGFNGDLVTLATLGTIEDINLDGAGATYAGRGFYVNDGFSQRLERCRAFNTKGPSLEFAADAGGGAHVSDFEGNTIDQTTVPAILMAGDTGPHPRFFEGIWLSGGLFQLGAGAGNGCSLTNFYIRNFVMPNSVVAGGSLMHISNGRVASIADTTTISGADCTFTGVAFSGPVVLDAAQGMKMVACTYGAGITENPENCQYNSFEDQMRAYTPTWTQSSGAQPALGDGSLTGNYVRNGYLCTVSLRLVMGSTTTFGNGGAAYVFSLPFKSHQSIDQRGMLANITDASAEIDYIVGSTFGGNLASFTLNRNGASVRDGYPFSWAVGDTIDMQFTYMVR